MLTLRREQLAVIGNAQFIEKAKRFLVEHFPEAAGSTTDDALVDFIRQATHEAKEQGFFTQRDTAIYLLAASLFGRGFISRMPQLQAAIAEFPSAAQQVAVIEIWALQALASIHGQKQA